VKTVACALVIAVAAGAAPARAVVLRGRVITLEGRPATDAQLQIVGHAALLAIRTPSGEFEQPLAGAPSQVEFAAVAGSLDVLYPPDGIVPVPRDETVHVTIVVGRPERSEISDLLAERLLRLETTLRANGVHFDAVRDSLSDDLHRVLAQLDVGEADLRRRVEFKREQAATIPEVIATIDAYIREVKDLRDALHQFGPLAAGDANAKAALQNALTEYNTAFAALNDNRRAYESKILNYWSGESAERLSKHLADVYFEAVENIHQALVLPLNPSLIDVQTKKPSRRQRDDATAAFARTAAQLDTRVAPLERRTDELRDALQRETEP
jgi:hypothetical protein